MDEQKMRYHLQRLNPGEIYWDRVHEESVEFGYMGQTGLAIVYEPGDSGGGMQSSWGIDPANLEGIVEDSR
ncbi:hypothetical protein ACFL0V_01235 [Nanoarchaeota archaeon]